MTSEFNQSPFSSLEGNRFTCNGLARFASPFVLLLESALGQELLVNFSFATVSLWDAMK